MCYKEILDGMLLASNQRHTKGKPLPASRSPEEGDGTSGSQACPISVDEDSGIVLEPAASQTSTNSSSRVSPAHNDLSISKDSPFEDFSWSLLFRHLHLDPDATLSEAFLMESRSVIHGNGLEPRLFDGKCLWDYVDCWVDLVKRLGLGRAESGPGSAGEANAGRTEDRLELVYRNVRTTSTKVDRKRKSRRVKGEGSQTGSSAVLTDEPMPMIGTTTDQLQATEEERLLALAIEESLKDIPVVAKAETAAAELEGLQDSLLPPRPAANSGQPSIGSIETAPSGDAEATQTSVRRVAPSAGQSATASIEADADKSKEVIEIDGDSETMMIADPSTPALTKVEKKSKRKRPKDGSIIGSHVFTHDRTLLAKSLESVMNFWMGTRQPEGVGIENVNRCGWCEFEEGCEWR